MAENILCSISGCDKPSLSRGWCRSHYHRFLRHGNPLGGRFLTNAERTCETIGCSKTARVRGMCDAHYRKKMKYGDALSSSPNKRLRETWISNHKDYPLDDCLTWPFKTGSFGRGAVMINGRRLTAPRAMCIAAHGEPPTQTHQAAHSCGNGHAGCLNPRHLRWATHDENMKDRAVHGRDRKGRDINTAKLTEIDVYEIRKMKGVRTCGSVAKDYGVTKSTIVKIMSRKTWAWLE